MGCFDGAEVFELVGLYRDDGLAMLKGLSGPETSRKKSKVFKDCGLKITIKANLHMVNFLDVTLDLRNNTYESYRKPDNHRAVQETRQPSCTHQ